MKLIKVEMEENGSGLKYNNCVISDTDKFNTKDVLNKMCIDEDDVVGYSIDLETVNEVKLENGSTYKINSIEVLYDSNSVEAFNIYKTIFSYYHDEPLKKFINETNYINHFNNDWGEVISVISKIKNDGYDIKKLVEKIQTMNIQTVYMAVYLYIKNNINR